MCTKYWLTAWEVGLSLPKKGVGRLTDRPDMTIDVYLGRKKQQQQPFSDVVHPSSVHSFKQFLL